MPTENHRSSVSLCSTSATVSRLGSKKTVEANSNVMPCLRAFASALASSHSSWNGRPFTTLSYHAGRKTGNRDREYLSIPEPAWCRQRNSRTSQFSDGREEYQLSLDFPTLHLHYISVYRSGSLETQRRYSLPEFTPASLCT